MIRADVAEQVYRAIGMPLKESDVLVCAIFESRSKTPAHYGTQKGGAKKTGKVMRNVRCCPQGRLPGSGSEHAHRSGRPDAGVPQNDYGTEPWLVFLR